MLAVSNASTLPIASSVIGTSFRTTRAVTTGTAPSPPRPPRPPPPPRPVAVAVAADPLPHASDVTAKPDSATAHTIRLLITTPAPVVKGRPHDQIPGSLDAHLRAARGFGVCLHTIDAVAASPLDLRTVSLRRRLCRRTVTRHLNRSAGTRVNHSHGALV